MKWLSWSVISLLLLVFFGVASWPEGRLKLTVCDVGQGDAVLISKGKIQVLIDGGSADEKVLECLNGNVPFWDRQIEMVVATHADKDHIGGLDGVLERYRVLHFVSNGIEGTNKDWQRIRGFLKTEGAKQITAKKGMKIVIEEMVFEVLWPDGQGEGGNENSVVMRLDFFDFEAIFTGDISQVEELAMVGSGVITKAEILKVAHHGSKTSSSEEFLEAVSPSLALIGVGKNNSYGHPSLEVLSRFDAVGARTLRTDINGEVDILSNGRRWWVTSER